MKAAFATLPRLRALRKAYLPLPSGLTGIEEARARRFSWRCRAPSCGSRASSPFIIGLTLLAWINGRVVQGWSRTVKAVWSS